MINIQPLDDEYEIKSIILNPILWSLHCRGQELPGTIDLEPNTKYLGIIYNKELAGMVSLEKFNNVTLAAHIYILPSYQKGKISLDAVEACKKYLKENTDIYKVITTVPMDCEHVHKFLARTDFKINGNITKSVIYNNKLQDQILYSLQIRGE